MEKILKPKLEEILENPEQVLIAIEILKKLNGTLKPQEEIIGLYERLDKIKIFDQLVDYGVIKTRREKVIPRNGRFPSPSNLYIFNKEYLMEQ